MQSHLHKRCLCGLGGCLIWGSFYLRILLHLDTIRVVGWRGRRRTISGASYQSSLESQIGIGRGPGCLLV